MATPLRNIKRKNRKFHNPSNGTELNLNVTAKEDKTTT